MVSDPLIYLGSKLHTSCSSSLEEQRMVWNIAIRDTSSCWKSIIVFGIHTRHMLLVNDDAESQHRSIRTS